MNVLVCAAHADDECLSMGGTIAKLTQAGHNVYCWFYFNGFNCNGVMQYQPREVAKILGTAEPPFVMRTTIDNEADTIPVLDIARNIEKAIAETEPEIVYMPSVHDLNIDHRRVAEAALAATRPVSGSTIHRVLSYEVPCVTNWAFGQFGHFVPNVYEELDESNLNKKTHGARLYGDIAKSYTHAIVSLAESRGCTSGFRFAEAFELVWERR